MSGLRVYVHDRHGRHANGDVRVRKAKKFHRCGTAASCYRRTPSGTGGNIIEPGEWYGIATLYPSDEDFNWLDRDTLEPSTTAVRLKVCIDCAGQDVRDLIAAFDMDLHHQRQKENTVAKPKTETDPRAELRRILEGMKADGITVSTRSYVGREDDFHTRPVGIIDAEARDLGMTY